MEKQPTRRHNNSLSSLDAIGIKDPVEVKQRTTIDVEVVKNFEEN